MSYLRREAAPTWAAISSDERSSQHNRSRRFASGWFWPGGLFRRRTVRASGHERYMIYGMFGEDMGCESRPHVSVDLSSHTVGP